MKTADLKFVKKLNEIKLISTSYQEDWSSINLIGDYDHSIFELYREAYELLSQIDGGHLIRFWFDSDEVIVSEIDDYEQSPNSFFKSKLFFNKQGYTIRNQQTGQYQNFFLTSDSCENWLRGLNAIDGRNPINLSTSLSVFVVDLENSIGSETFQILPLVANDISPNNHGYLPSFATIQENIHFISDIPISFNLNHYALIAGDYQNRLGKALLELSEVALSVAVVDEFYNSNKIILNGLKRLVLKIGEESDTNFDYLQNLVCVVKWLYEDRINTRKKLFNERLTLEVDESTTLLKALREQLTPAFEQAKERYNFVILDRKDAYAKELKDLLKDLRAQSDLYSYKIRTLLNNFLRDVLAALVLVGFTIFTKFTDNIGLDKNKLLTYVFDGLALYFLISIAFQSIVDITDMNITTKELTYWKKAAKELISEREFNLHYQNSLRSRKLSIIVLYPLIGLLYIVIAMLCFKYPFFFEHIIKK